MSQLRLLSTEGELQVEKLINLSERPPLFSQGAPFWDDPHLSEQLLAAHLDQQSDAASRRIPTVVGTVKWIAAQAGKKLVSGGRLLDLGCGPGLYAQRFARLGARVVGVDISSNSLKYARRQARKENLNIEYICCDYTSLEVNRRFDIICLIYCDFGALSDIKRDMLMEKIEKFLVPGGYFFFDVHTPKNRRHLDESSWEVRPEGFWHPGKHLLLTKQFEYDGGIFLDQYVVLDEKSQATVYRIWERTYSPRSIATLIREHGLQVDGIFGDLQGTRLTKNSECMGVVARKPCK